MSRVDDLLTAVAASLEAVKLLESEFRDMDLKERSASRMMAAQMLLQHAAMKVGPEVGQHPRTVLEKIVEGAMKNLPEMPAPKVEEMPSRPVKAGKSPWGEVR
jgi:hypothetical protein